MVQITFVSLDSSSDKQRHALWIEVNEVVGVASDPLEILCNEEEEWTEEDTAIALAILNTLHARAKPKRRYERGCTYPQCYRPCRHCR